MTRLRKMMLEELQRRNYSEITTRKYLKVVSDFAKHFGKSPDKLGPNELRFLPRRKTCTSRIAHLCPTSTRVSPKKTASHCEVRLRSIRSVRTRRVVEY